ncbi:hypothetical protein L228DRAFT_260244 [Xylona heveae TC161]|uniref:Atos-like conserved domain-containing protein n=1 Tax=Xylona heveae (strain CBS 132557 / TC161) TaxID=1328760 RepID=A0A165HF09_XYLHT|nr:hypothetical protein L228DRAFT_260244 [Xylona heveae TC161]KZF23413.1 hypothetical protein L228DRAFT_260244 [Xylona heveae TC161]
MPMFHDPGDLTHPDPPPSSAMPDSIWRPSPQRPSAETMRAGNLEKSIQSVVMDTGIPPDESQVEPNRPGLETTDRRELIRRIKRGESPTWIPNNPLQDYLRDSTKPDNESNNRPNPPVLSTSPTDDYGEPAAPESEKVKELNGERLGLPAEIQRPRSALHSGDFTQQPPATETGLPALHTPEHQSNHEPEHASKILQRPPWPEIAFPHHPVPNFQDDPRFPPPQPISSSPDASFPRLGIPSLSSFSSGFILKTPTSPLVQQSNNTDLDFSAKTKPIEISPTSKKGDRRHTMPPHARYSLQASPDLHATKTHAARFNPSLRREGTFPYQAHQPRRSISNQVTLQPASTSHSPSFLRVRRPSLSSDTYPLHHAPMVGSYEESILHGRMSTTPSRPLNFVAQIGVLGKGNCKANLRCPPHVSVPFPAVFYSYGAGSARTSSSAEDGPSPYVGLIDLENHLPSSEEASEVKKKKQLHERALQMNRVEPSAFHDHKEAPGCIAMVDPTDRRRKEKKGRRSTSPKAPPGGSYRIPQQGQLQIVIKNPNKTAVKLFLVPYDLSGMEPGTKTFVRQRSYSAGPIIEKPVTSRPDLPQTPGPGDKPTLRYMIHLHICCPSKGRFYLYKSIRVVFANRVPDGKERLLNDIQVPEPKYSSYKPRRESTLLNSPHGTTHALGSERSAWRRSVGAHNPSAFHSSERMPPFFHFPPHDSMGHNNAFHHPEYASISPTQPAPVESIRPLSWMSPHLLSATDHVNVQASSHDQDSLASSYHPSRLPLSPAQPMDFGHDTASPSLWNDRHANDLTINDVDNDYGKLDKHHPSYGNNRFSPSAAPFGSDSSPGESLLARKLRDLGMRRASEDEDDRSIL